MKRGGVVKLLSFCISSPVVLPPVSMTLRIFQVADIMFKYKSIERINNSWKTDVVLFF